VSRVETCRECGGIFAFLPRGICAGCQDIREESFQTVKEWLLQNRGARVRAASEATGVGEGLIASFIRDGRLEFVGVDAGQLEGIDHEEDVKARIRAQLAAQAGPTGTDPRGPAAASPQLGMRSRGQ
jgi:predicted  nucleic acid-binding Zn-ribbon protein